MGFSNPIIYVQLKKSSSALEPLGLASEKAGTKFRGIIIAVRTAASKKSRT